MKFFEHHLNEYFSVLLRVSRRFRHQNGTIFRCHLQFIYESMMPHFVHIFPILYDSIDNRPWYIENTLFRCDLMADINIFLIHADHLSRLFWPSNDSWKTRLWRIISSDTHFYESTSTINDQCGILVHLTIRLFKTYFL